MPNHLTGLNLFAYCDNNPVMYTDPSGNSISLGILVLIGAGVGLISGAVVSGATYSITTDNFSWKEFGINVLGGMVSGTISGAISTWGAGLFGVVGTIGMGALGGGLGSLADSVIQKSFSGTLFDEKSKCELLWETVWGAAGGAIGGLIGGPNGSSAATVLSKFLKHPIKNFVSEFAESLLSDFTNWYAKFVTEKTVVNSKKIGV